MNYILLHASDGGILGHCSTWWWWTMLFFSLGAILHWLLAAVAAAAPAAPAVVPVPVPVPASTEKMGIVSDAGDAEGSIYAGLFKNDNFQIIEGIGPKVNSVLINAGYKTWSDLAAADSNDIRKHLDDAGKRFGLCDPTTWPHQAGLAANGNWEELIRYQKFTDGGRETGSGGTD